MYIIDALAQVAEQGDERAIAAVTRHLEDAAANNQATST